MGKETEGQQGKSWSIQQDGMMENTELSRSLDIYQCLLA